MKFLENYEKLASKRREMTKEAPITGKRKKLSKKATKAVCYFY